MQGLVCHILALYGALTRMSINLQHRGKTERVGWREEERKKLGGADYTGPFLHFFFSQMSIYQVTREEISSNCQRYGKLVTVGKS